MTNEKNLLKRGADKTVKNCIKEDERGRPRVKATDSCFRWLIAQTQDMQIKLANKRRAAWHQDGVKRKGTEPNRPELDWKIPAKTVKVPT